MFASGVWVKIPKIRIERQKNQTELKSSEKEKKITKIAKNKAAATLFPENIRRLQRTSIDAAL